jgi:hypothetical protein
MKFYTNAYKREYCAVELWNFFSIYALPTCRKCIRGKEIRFFVCGGFFELLNYLMKF